MLPRSHGLEKNLKNSYEKKIIEQFDIQSEQSQNVINLKLMKSIPPTIITSFIYRLKLKKKNNFINLLIFSSQINF